MEKIISLSLSQLAYQAPLLLIYLVGMVLGLMFWRRYPGPSMLTLISTGILLSVSVIQIVATQYLFQAHIEMGWETKRFSWMVSAIGLTGSLLRALAIGLLLAAVFLGRRVAHWTETPE